ncbi:hypothetical protein RvY_06349 [Ramazzottius varieornatus]|uniref:Midasin n=1 Tax=Ramazzottius varieornatus TaxID=947166 RepID=A0A1D1UYU6_RAMVA|nr:hypothetical protein RvY_06349 [Ramazzottius varieornatus]
MDFIISESLQKEVLDSLRLYIKHNKPVLLSGAVGSGKSSLLRHVAALSGRKAPLQLLTIQLSRDLDSKALLGSYHCTQVGTEFQWVPGLLTMAVMHSSWLVLEDIDQASVDLMSVLLPVMQRRVLHIPEVGRTIPVGNEFRLFATSRMATSALPTLHSDTILLSHFKHLHMPQMPWNELSTITNQVFPNLSLILPRLLEIFQLLSGCDTVELDFALKRAIHARASLLRDFFRLCRRLSKYAAANSMERIGDVFLDVFCCCCAFISDSTNRLELAKRLGAILGLSNTDVEFYVSKRSVTLARREEEQKLTVGHTDLPINADQSNTTDSSESSLQSTDDRYTSFSLHGSALRLIDQLAVCVANKEFPLLVGETGTGKTTVFQFLAQMCNRRLHVINLSHQSEMGDLVGGYKPVEFSLLVAPVKDAFLQLFAGSFSVMENERFLSNFHSAFVQKNYAVLVKGMRHITNSALRRKKSKDGGVDGKEQAWTEFDQRLTQLEQQFTLSQKSLLFSFLEGKLVTSYREGDWVLLDEINLASPEVLAGLHSFLDSSVDSFILSEKGEGEIVRRHKDFRVMACMNPATDVGKRDLPIEVRSRATEIFCDDLTERAEVAKMVVAYLSEVVDEAIVHKTVELYFRLREKAEKELVDDSNRKVHYSLRTFTRALQFAAKVASSPGLLLRHLYEGFCLSYLTQLNRLSQLVVKDLLVKTLFDPTTHNLLSLPLPKPSSGQFVQVQGYWLPRGTLPVVDDASYILTETVQSNLAEISRAISAGQLPVLLQGETSVGKTSMITWLAKKTGNKCVRINNHQHTDIQDYIGSWQSDQEGKLLFREGVLLQAMRKGFWIILDELNLASSDVLEALNRLLDANRELFVAECQQSVKAHPHFMLFGTQNPPGYYGGRQTLSRAFRNRFIEIHFGEIPAKELQEILHQRGALPPAYAKKMIDVMLELQAIRKMSGIFAGKQGFITLRDLFRWAERYRLTAAPKDAAFFDWEQHLADHGFLLLAGRVRKAEEAAVVKATMEKHFKRIVDEEALFGASTSPLASSTAGTLLSFTNFSARSADFSHLVWTSNLKRLVALAGSALAYGEAVLLVGETGCGKTTISQVYAQLQKSQLFSLNCHMNTETSDFLGGLRPARKEGSLKLFEWKDGVLLQAMKEGGVLLLDEISLADDSVLERINSVLEPARTIVLTEKGGDNEELQADKAFRFVATMNPGGDFGKKELSAALRNRFTEVWCTNLSVPHDVRMILHHNLMRKGSFVMEEAAKTKLVNCMVDFIVWLKEQNTRMMVSSRDVMMWMAFINQFLEGGTERALVATSVKEPFLAYYHATSMVFGSHPQVGTTKNSLGWTWEQSIDKFVHSQTNTDDQDGGMGKTEPVLLDSEERFGVEPFFMTKRIACAGDSSRYCFDSRSVRQNVMRILRSLVVTRGILLEGPPGVGKTSTVQALAAKTGYQVVRINLSEQTDISDLFGADMPVEGETAQFAWQDGPFLQAMKKGAWILLDELNLASQSVLEGLNACLDHRSQVFIPELGRTFTVNTDSTRIFACQNPLNQGSGRKGLPASFLNRFTQVYIEPLLEADLLAICLTAFPTLPADHVASLLHFNAEVEELVRSSKLGSSGQPWEFNLRDVMRCCELATKHSHNGDPQGQTEWQNALLDLVYVGRFRTEEDRRKVAQLAADFGLVFSSTDLPRRFLKTELTDKCLLVGCCQLARHDLSVLPSDKLQLLHSQSAVMEKLALCVEHKFVSILVGHSGVGKSSLVEALACLTGRKLRLFSMNSATDAAELLGGFEQRVVSARTTSKVTFEWRNSEVVEAMLAGEWLLIDNSNLCNPAVLDRLNSVLEPAGQLLLSERGSVAGEMVVVRPAEGFRLFLTVNPQYGELSRAMRNRGVEIFVDESISRRDSLCLLVNEGLEDGLAANLADICQDLGVNLEQVRNVGEEVAMRLDEGCSLDMERAFKAALPNATISNDRLKALVAPSLKSPRLVPFPVVLVDLLRHRLERTIQRKFNALGLVTELIEKKSTNVVVSSSLNLLAAWLLGLSLKENGEAGVMAMVDTMVGDGRLTLSTGVGLLREVEWGVEALLGFEWKQRVMDVLERVMAGQGLHQSSDQRLRVLLDFVHMWAEAVAHKLVSNKEKSLEKEDNYRAMVAALWLRSLMTVVDLSWQSKGGEMDGVNVALLWRLVSKEVVAVTEGLAAVGSPQSAALHSARGRLNEDLCSEESLLSGQNRQKLGGDEPFKSKDDFDRMAQLRRSSDPTQVARLLPTILPFHQAGSMGGSRVEGRLWRLLQLAFCLKRQRSLRHFVADSSGTMVQRQEGLRELMDTTESLPWVIRQMALLLKPATLTLSLLQQSSLHFALMWPFRREAYTDTAQAMIFDCNGDTLWSKEVMVQLTNGASLLERSKLPIETLWRLGDAEVHVQRLKELQMVLWKQLLDKEGGKGYDNGTLKFPSIFRLARFQLLFVFN